MEKKRCLSCFREYEEVSCPHCGYPDKTSTESHQLSVGTLLRKRYQIGKVLGQGGFGITYLGWDTLLLQTVAIKEFYPNGSVFRRAAVSTQVQCSTDAMIPHYEYTRERFLREAQALVRFREIPEVVDILDFIEENNTAYIVMEYVRGVDLAKYIQRKGGRLSVDETFRILKPVMEALAKVHKGGIVHRDISPDNIILDPMGGAKLLDFGAVRVVEDPDVDKGLSKSTEAILKQGFAPIEQYNTRGSLGPWTDEYAMCATVWYCLTGRIPEEASIRMGEGIDPDWTSIPDLPEHQQKALEKGISCRAKDRYPSMDQLLADLFPVEETPTAQPPVREIQEPEKKPAQKPSKNPADLAKLRRNMKIAMIAAAVAAVVLIILLLPKKPIDRVSLLNEPQETDPVQEIQQPEHTDPVTVPTIETTEPTTEPLSPEEEAYLHAESLLAEGKLGEAAIAFGKLAGYEDARERSFEIWERIAVRETVSGGYRHTVGLKTDGTAVAVGDNTDPYYNGGQCDVSGWTDIIAVSAGAYHTVGLKADGTVVAVGSNYTNQYYKGGRCDVEGWTDIVAVSAGGSHTVGLKADGTVVAVGYNHDGLCDVDGWTDIVAVSAGENQTVGLKADGTVVAVGYNYDGACNVSGWTDIVAVSAGGYHTVGLKADGTVVAVGYNYTDQYYKGGRCDVEGWTDIVAVSAGGGNTVGLKADGTVVATGDNRYRQCDLGDWADVSAVAAGYYHTLVLFSDGTLAASGAVNAGDNIVDFGQTDVAGWTDIRIPKERVPFR